MKRLAVLFVFFVLTIPHANAQFFKKLKKKAENAVERTITRKTEREVEKTTDRALDSVMNAPKKDRSKKRSDKNSGGVMGNILGGAPAVIEDDYTFPMSATMLVEDFDGKKSTTEMIQGYGDNAIVTFQKNEPNPMIIDFENKSAVMLDLKKKSGQAISLEFMEKMMGGGNVSNNDDDGEVPTFRKTGNTKTMNGYLCEEYEIIAEDYQSEVWFAPQVDFTYQDYFKGFVKMFKGNTNLQQMPIDTYGYIMQMTSYDKKGKITMKMTVTEINKTPKTYQMSDFKIQKL
ncbi:MAG: hypothetical protein CMC74_08545 [Flavobacteriaceae bacterium]|nr:hypothetical protein [Flavobacteriaceae bacterium]|tara:strand:+ start:39085 stop:39948 length:864 start_codon:yes stop_codon:yes gene_type:complete